MPSDTYHAIRDELNNGGIAALHHYLLQVDLSGFDHDRRRKRKRSAT